MSNTLAISGKTAISRKTASKPCQIAYERGFVQSPMIDWGCGRGADVEWLRNRFIDCFAYDPNYFPTNPSIYKYEPLRPDYIHCFYVLNVIEHVEERETIVRDILDVLPGGGSAMFAVRSAGEVSNNAYHNMWEICRDGYRTRTGTFQKGFLGWELGAFLQDNGFKSALIVNSDPLMVLATKGR